MLNKEDNDLTRIYLLFLVIVAAVVIIAALLFSSKTGSTISGGYYSVYFSSDTNNSAASGNVNFFFTAENHFNLDKSIPFEVFVDNNFIVSNILQIKANGSVTKQVVLPYRTDILTHGKVLVKFPDSNQEIFYYLGPKALATFDNNIALINADILPSIIKRDQNFAMTMSFLAIEKIDQNYMVFIHFYDADNKIAFQYDHYPQIDGNIINTTAWSPNVLFNEKFVDKIPADVPDGNYAFDIGFYIPGELPVRTKLGQDKYIVKTITVVS